MGKSWKSFRFDVLADGWLVIALCYCFRWSWWSVGAGGCRCNCNPNPFRLPSTSASLNKPPSTDDTRSEKGRKGSRNCLSTPSCASFAAGFSEGYDGDNDNDHLGPLQCDDILSKWDGIAVSLSVLGKSMLGQPPTMRTILIADLSKHHSAVLLDGPY